MSSLVVVGFVYGCFCRGCVAVLFWVCFDLRLWFDFAVAFIVFSCGFGYGLLLGVSVLRMFLVDCLLWCGGFS